MSDKTLEMRIVFSAIDKFVRPMKNITDASRGASKALNEAKASLKGLNDQQKLIDRFRTTDKSLGINGQDLEKARAHAKRLGEELKEVEKPTAAMQKAFKHATDEARNLAGTVNRLREQKQHLRQELVTVGIDTKALSSYQKELKSNMDSATAAVAKQDDALRKINKRKQLVHAAQADGDKIRTFGARASSYGRGAIAAGTGVSAASGIPVVAYAKAEDASTQLKIAMMQKGGNVSSQFGEIDALANKLGNKLPGTTADFQDMMTMLIRQGMPAKNILGGLGEATAYLAVQLKMAPTAAAEFASELQDSTRTADKDMMALMDTIQKTFNLGVKQDYMLQGFGKMAAALSILKKEGLDATSSLTPFLVMANQSGMTDGGSAGNAYRKIIQLSLDKKKVAKGNAELAGTGVSLDFTNGKGNFGGIEKLFSELDKLKKIKSDQKRIAAEKKIFGDDSETHQALDILKTKGIDGYRATLEKMEAQANIQERVNAQLGTLKSLWDAASGTFTNTLVALGESVSPELHATAELLGKLAERSQAWAKENPGLANTLMNVAKWAGIITVTLGGLLLAVGALTVPLAIMNTGLAALGLTGAANVLGGILAKLGLLAVAFGVGYAAGDLFNGWLNKGLSLIVGYDTSLGSLIYDLVEKFKATDWSMLGQWIVEGIEKGLDLLTYGLYSKVRDLSSGIATAAREALGIKSPSRVFAEIGGFTMQGLEQGIEHGKKHPIGAVASMAKKMATVTAGVAISGVAMAGDGLGAMSSTTARNQSGQSIVLNIYPSQGMDEKALAVAVRLEIERLDRERMARHRGMLRDSH